MRRLACLLLILCCCCNGTPILPPAVTPEASLMPTATVNYAPTLIVLDRRIVSVRQTVVRALPTAASVIATLYAPTPESTSVPALCQPCQGDRDCPSGYMCKYCPGLGDICVRLSSPNADCQNCRTEPLWIGWATYYIHGEITRSGEKLDLNAYKCAVDDTEWAKYKGKLLRVCDDDNCIRCRVNDSGYLYDAGMFQWGVQKIGQYWVEWFFKSPVGYRIVIDLTPQAYNELNPRGLVQVWVIE